MTRIFSATTKHKGTCIYCGQPIVPGDRLKKVLECGNFLSAHVTCANNHADKMRKKHEHISTVSN